MLLILSVIGSSVERHAQQQFVKQELMTEMQDYTQRAAAVIPGQGLAALFANEITPFAAYFKQLADKVGHPHRDSLMTLIEYNGPDVEVRHPLTGEVIYTLRSAFPDGQFLTFSNDITEINFFALGKETIALQVAANQSIDYLQRPTTALDEPAAVKAALTAAHLMWAMKAKILDFMTNKTFDSDFFLDVFRQYQCLWYPDQYLKPPSAANDAASLLRDVMLFDDLVGADDQFPGFRRHVVETGSVLMTEDKERVQVAMARPSLETKIFAHLDVNRTEFAKSDEVDIKTIVEQNPWLMAYLLLYNAQRDLSRTHYALVMKFIIRPKQIRNVQQDPREYITVVNNERGTTGLDPLGIMVRLDEARYNHPLSHLNGDRYAKQMKKSYASSLGYVPLSHNAYLSLSNLTQETQPRRASTAVHQKPSLTPRPMLQCPFAHG